MRIDNKTSPLLKVPMDNKEVEREEQKSPIKSMRWTEVEKKMLLRVLKRYGSNNPHKLKQFLPNKSVNAITKMIKKYQAIAELGKRNANSPLDIWLRSGIFSTEPNLIPEALLLICLFEDHPHPEDTAGFDLKKAYNFLHKIMKRSSSSLPLKTAELIKSLMITVDKETWPSEESSIREYLIKEVCINKSPKCYERKKK